MIFHPKALSFFNPLPIICYCSQVHRPMGTVTIILLRKSPCNPELPQFFSELHRLHLHLR